MNKDNPLTTITLTQAHIQDGVEHQAGTTLRVPESTAKFLAKRNRAKGAPAQDKADAKK